MNGTDIEQVAAAGTVYTLTASSAAVDFGTTDPSVTLTSPGNYLLMARANVKFVGATFSAVKTLTIILKRTNNTAGTVVSTVVTLPIVTTVSHSFGVIELPKTIYQTANGGKNGDIISMFAALESLPDAGTVTIAEAEVLAVRIF